MEYGDHNLNRVRFVPMFKLNWDDFEFTSEIKTSGKINSNIIEYKYFVKSWIYENTSFLKCIQIHAQINYAKMYLKTNTFF